MRYKNKPIEVEAFKYDGDLKDGDGNYYVPQWAVEAFEAGILFYVCLKTEPGELFIKGRLGAIHVKWNDYIVLMSDGTLDVCNAKDFEKDFERIEE